MSKFRTTIQPADRSPEIAVVVEYAYHKADDGGREYPSTPAYIEIESITHGRINLTAYLADHILIDIEQEIEADMDAAAKLRKRTQQSAWRNIGPNVLQHGRSHANEYLRIPSRN